LSPGQISGHSTPTNTPALGDTLLPPTNISARRQARSEDPTARRHPSVRAIRLVPLRGNHEMCHGSRGCHPASRPDSRTGRLPQPQRRPTGRRVSRPGTHLQHRGKGVPASAIAPEATTHPAATRPGHPARGRYAGRDPDAHPSPQCQVSSRRDAGIADCLLLLCAPWATEAAMLSPGQISGHSTPTNTPALGDTLLPPTNISARRQARSEDPTARRHPSVRAIRLVPLRENRATCRGYTTRARQRHWSVVPRHLRTQ
jgi:hypothetical protein